MEPEAYATAVVELVQRGLGTVVKEPPDYMGWRVDPWTQMCAADIRLMRRGEAHVVAGILAFTHRRDCRFGFTWEIPWEYCVEESPAETASLVIVNWEEQVAAAGHGLPEACVPNAVTWMPGHAAP